MISGGFVKTIVAFGRTADVYYTDGEGYSAFMDDLPHLEVRGETLGDIIYELEVAISVENELDALWESEGVIENESEDEDDH
jgi:hypothetical protein